jgi:3-ketosteroid 9alpha-monooxygenase subunit A
MTDTAVGLPGGRRTHAAPPASHERYPMSPYPTGWYLVCTSAELAVGEVKPLTLLGRDLVVFRTEGGTAVVLDAHCPHMGAHLGHGGVVEGEGVRCPFHKWRFDVDGRCDDVPYGERRHLPQTAIHCWTVAESSGLVYLFHSESGVAPTWSPPVRPEWGAPGWVGYASTEWTIRMHVQELVENIPDTAHFHVVHGIDPMPVAHIDLDGHVYRQRTCLPDGFEVTRQEAHGMGLVWLHSSSRMPFTFLTATTPIDDQTVSLRLLFLVHEGEGATELSAMGRMIVDSTSENTGRDVPIWEHKVYRERAPLVPGDGPINELRRWCRQFYEA